MPRTFATSWERPREALELCCQKRTLGWTVRVALVVGTILTFVNQSHLILAGEATAVIWLRTAANYVVPFCVSNVGVLAATRRRPSDDQ